MLNQKSKLIVCMVVILYSGFTNAVEVKPIETIKSTESYGPDHIEFYKIKNGDNELFLQQYPLLIENATGDANFLSEIDSSCEIISKVFKQQDTIYVITYTCGLWYGASSAEKMYTIYEFNDELKLIATQKIDFQEDLEVNFSELESGIKIRSNQSKSTGKIYHYEYKEQMLYDLSTAAKDTVIAKEKERICRGFYEQVYIQYKYQPHLSLGRDLYDLLSSANYSWVADSVKQSQKLSDQLAHELIEKTLKQRQNTAYSIVKKKYC